MSVKIYDSTIGAFKDADTPMVWDSQAQAWKDSVGLVWNESAQAWEERWSAGRLPTIYQEVEYIQSDGMQYIDTGLTASFSLNGWATDICFEMTENSNFSDIIASGSPMYMQINPTNLLVIGCGGGNYETSGQILYVNQKYNVRVSVVRNNFYYFINEVQQSINLPNYNATYNEKLTLFCKSREVQGYGMGNYAKMKLYFCKIFDGQENMVRDFIPCYRKSDQVAGMYDLVSGE